LIPDELDGDSIESCGELSVLHRIRNNVVGAAKE